MGDTTMILHTEETGDGSRRIALLHGVSGDQSIFHDLAERLAELDYTVIGVDLRGHGESDRASSYELADFADDVVETLPTGLDVVAGHSLGAAVLAAAVERLQPHRAVYLDPAWFVPETFDDVAMHANVGEHADGSAYSLQELEALNPGWGADNLRRAQMTHNRWDSTMLPSLSVSIGRGRDPIGEPPVPSLVLMAGDSPLYADFPTDQICSLGYEVRVQPGAGHNLHLDDPDATIECLQGWI